MSRPSITAPRSPELALLPAHVRADDSGGSPPRDTVDSTSTLVSSSNGVTLDLELAGRIARRTMNLNPASQLEQAPTVVGPTPSAQRGGARAPGTSSPC